jgi:hypothetical protein
MTTAFIRVPRRQVATVQNDAIGTFQLQAIGDNEYVRYCCHWFPTRCNRLMSGWFSHSEQRERSSGNKLNAIA